jgi:hypothetical protein
VADSDAGNGCSGLQAFLNDLGLERFRIRASLAHRNPGDKGDRVRLKIRGHLSLDAGVGKVSWPDAYRDVATAATAATTHKEWGLERGDKSGDSRHFLRASAVMLDRLFEWV